MVTLQQLFDEAQGEMSGELQLRGVIIADDFLLPDGTSVRGAGRASPGDSPITETIVEKVSWANVTGKPSWLSPTSLEGFEGAHAHTLSDITKKGNVTPDSIQTSGYDVLWNQDTRYPLFVATDEEGLYNRDLSSALLALDAGVEGDYGKLYIGNGTSTPSISLDGNSGKITGKSLDLSNYKFRQDVDTEAGTKYLVVDSVDLSQVESRLQFRTTVEVQKSLYATADINTMGILGTSENRVDLKGNRFVQLHNDYVSIRDSRDANKLYLMSQVDVKDKLIGEETILGKKDIVTNDKFSIRNSAVDVDIVSYLEEDTGFQFRTLGFQGELERMLLKTQPGENDRIGSIILDTPMTVVKNSIGTENFFTGWTGTGWRINKRVDNQGDPDFEATKYIAEFDELTVRGRMRIYELVANKIRATNGILAVTDTAVAYSLSPGQVSYQGQLCDKIFIRPEYVPVPLWETDYIKSQEFDTETNPEGNTSAIVRVYEGEVLKVFTDMTDKENRGKTEYIPKSYILVKRMGASDAPWDDMVMVRTNSRHEDRKGIIMLDSVSDGAPFIDWTWGGVTEMRAGNLGGVTWNGKDLSLDYEAGPNDKGEYPRKAAKDLFGLVANNVYLDGEIWARRGFIGPWSIVQDRIHRITSVRGSDGLLKPSGALELGKYTHDNDKWGLFSYEDSSNYIGLQKSDSTYDWGITGKIDNKELFFLGGWVDEEGDKHRGGRIGSWTIEGDRIKSQNLVLHSSGYIENTLKVVTNKDGQLVQFEKGGYKFENDGSGQIGHGGMVWDNQGIFTFSDPVRDLLRGLPGETQYTWVMYADDALGSNMSASPVDKLYIGIANNQSSPIPGNNPDVYSWVKARGDKGVPGIDGNDGITYYTWVKYADSVNGVGMSDSHVGKKFIGLAYKKTTAQESTNPVDYKWSKLVGDDGQDGRDGRDGVDGALPYKYIGAVTQPPAGSEGKLVVSDTYFGYVDNDRNWATYLAPGGGFYLRGDGNAGLFWNPGNNENTPQLTVKGHIEATSGLIGGWTLQGDNLHSEHDTDGTSILLSADDTRLYFKDGDTSTVTIGTKSRRTLEKDPFYGFHAYNDASLKVTEGLTLLQDVEIQGQLKLTQEDTVLKDLLVTGNLSVSSYSSMTVEFMIGRATADAVPWLEMRTTYRNFYEKGNPTTVTRRTFPWTGREAKEEETLTIDVPDKVDHVVFHNQYNNVKVQSTSSKDYYLKPHKILPVFVLPTTDRNGNPYPEGKTVEIVVSSSNSPYKVAAVDGNSSRTKMFTRSSFDNWRWSAMQVDSITTSGSCTFKLINASQVESKENGGRIWGIGFNIPRKLTWALVRNEAAVKYYGSSSGEIGSIGWGDISSIPYWLQHSNITDFQNGHTHDLRYYTKSQSDSKFLEVIDGNVGIGTTSPSSKLEIRDTTPTLRLGTTVNAVGTNELGRLEFYAPHESSGGNSRNIGASVVARAEASFNSTRNPTALDFRTSSDTGATTKMTITNNGNVGIGTASPAKPLHVAQNLYTSIVSIDPNIQLLVSNNAPGKYAGIGIASADNAASFIKFYSGTNNPVWDIIASGENHDYDGRFDIRRNGVQYLTLSKDGNVGIGTNSPAYKFHVNGESRFDGIVHFHHATARKTGTLYTASNGNTWLNADGGRDLWLNWISNSNRSSNTNLMVGDGNIGAAILSVIGADRRVGIGTSSPSAPLDVNGDIALSSGIINQYGSQIRLDINPNAVFRLGRGSNSVNFGVQIFRGDNTATLNHEFRGVGDSHVNSNNGNFGVGDTSPSHKLTVAGSARLKSTSYIDFGVDQTDSGIISMGVVSVNGNGFINAINHTDASNSTLEFRVNSGVKMDISEAGNVTIGTPSASASFTAQGLNVHERNIQVTGYNTDRYLRFSKSLLQGSYIGYLGSQNRLDIGVHNTNDAAVANDNPVISILRSNGFMGINAINPRVPLEVQGNSYLIGDVATDLIFSYSGTNLQLGRTTGHRVVSTGDLEVGNYASGWTGSGVRFRQNGDGELTNLSVRGRLEAYEFVKKYLSSIGGNQVVSDDMVIDRIEDIGASYRFWQRVNPYGEYDDITLQQNDIIGWQTSSAEGGGIDSRVGTALAGGVDSNNRYIIVTKTSIDGDSPRQGDTIVRIGSTTNTNRQGLLYLTSNDTNAPYMDVVNGINAASKWNTSSSIKLRVGRLNGIGSLTGYGIADGKLRFWMTEDSARIGGWNFTHRDTAGSALVSVDNQMGMYSRTDGSADRHSFLRINTGSSGDWTGRSDSVMIGVDSNSEVNHKGIKALDASGNTLFQLGRRQSDNAIVNSIASWVFDSDSIYTGDKFVYSPTESSGLTIRKTSSSGGEFVAHKDRDNYIRMFYADANNWGIQGYQGSGGTRTVVFGLGSTNQIAGWTFTQDWLNRRNIYFGHNLYQAPQTNSLLIGTYWSDLDTQGNNVKTIRITGSNPSDWVGLYSNQDNSVWGIQGNSRSGQVFHLGSTNKIAGWKFNTTSLYKDLGSVRVQIGDYPWASGWTGVTVGKGEEDRISLLTNSSGSASVLECFTGGNLHFALTTEGTNLIAGAYFNSGSIWSGNVNFPSWKLDAAGSGELASGSIFWDADGNANFTGSVTVTGGAVKTKLDSLRDLAYKSKVGTGQLDSTIISGGKIKTGLLNAAEIKSQIITTNYIEGLSLNFQQGKVGGWTLSSNKVWSGTSTRKIEMRSGSTHSGLYVNGSSGSHTNTGSLGLDATGQVSLQLWGSDKDRVLLYVQSGRVQHQSGVFLAADIRARGEFHATGGVYLGTRTYLQAKRGDGTPRHGFQSCRLYSQNLDAYVTHVMMEAGPSRIIYLGDPRASYNLYRVVFIHGRGGTKYIRGASNLPKTLKNADSSVTNSIEIGRQTYMCYSDGLYWNCHRMGRGD